MIEQVEEVVAIGIDEIAHMAHTGTAEGRNELGIMEATVNNGYEHAFATESGLMKCIATQLPELRIGLSVAIGRGGLQGIGL